MTTRQILVTAALPYANGPIHIGHLVEYIQTDIWVRFQRLRNHRCIYICADDTHGTAIMMSARKHGVTEEQWISDMNASHQRDFAGFNVSFDHYGSTHSDANREICGQVWQSLRDADLIVERDVTQLYDAEAETFLADRFVKGTCPRNAKCRRTVRRSLRHLSVIPTLQSELIDPRQHAFGSHTGSCEVQNTCKFNQAGIAPRVPRRVDTDAASICSLRVANYLKGHFLGETGSTENPSKELKDWDVTRPARNTSGSRSPGLKTVITGTSGLMHPSGISRQPKSGATRIMNPSTIGGKANRPRFIISLARTSHISTLCSGQACLKRLALRCPKKFTSTVS